MAPVATVDRTIPFIDTHHHLWELDRFRYEWLQGEGSPETEARLGDYAILRTSWGPGRLFREFRGSGVVGSVHVEADYGGPDPVEETAWLDAVAREFGMPNALVIFCDLTKPDAPKQLARHLEASNLVRGVRLRSHADIDDTHVRRGFQSLERHGLSYELNASPGRLLAGRDTAKALPNTQIILGHCGLPLRRDREYFELWRREVSSLAEMDNIACKVSGLAICDHNWTIDSIRPWILHCIEAFGTSRTIFGTNWPVDLLYAPYIEQVDAYRSILSQEGYTPEEQAALLHGNAERLYKIELATETRPGSPPSGEASGPDPYRPAAVG